MGFNRQGLEDRQAHTEASGQRSRGHAQGQAAISEAIGTTLLVGKQATRPAGVDRNRSDVTGAAAAIRCDVVRVFLCREAGGSQPTAQASRFPRSSSTLRHPRFSTIRAEVRFAAHRRVKDDESSLKGWRVSAIGRLCVRKSGLESQDLVREDRGGSAGIHRTEPEGTWEVVSPDSWPAKGPQAEVLGCWQTRCPFPPFRI